MSKNKTKFTDSSIAKLSKTLHESYASGKNKIWCDGKHLSEETKQKISRKLIEFNHANLERNLHNKGGWFDNIYFMSTWELAYYIYMKDTGHIINRCEKRFKYIYLNKPHYYTPDFVLDDNLIVEIKGYEHEVDLVKYEAVINYGENFKVLYEKDMKEMLDYVKNKFNVKQITELYIKK